MDALNGVGLTAPAGNSKQPLGSAAPAGNGNAAGNPSSPSLDNAIVAEKKKAEHWRGKAQAAESKIASYEERLAKLEGLAQGLSVSGGQNRQQAATSFSDLDDGALDEVIKRGIDDQNPAFISAAAREMARRAAEKSAESVSAKSRQDLEQLMARQRVNAQINQEFGPDAINEESELRQQAERILYESIGGNQSLLTSNPGIIYLAFAEADRRLRANDKAEFSRLKDAEAKRLADEELFKAQQAIHTKARDDVKDALSKGDLKGAMKTRLSGILGGSR